MIPVVDEFISVVEALVTRVLIHSVYRRRITGVATLLASCTMVFYSLDPHNPLKEEPLLWLAWVVLHGLSWFFIFLFFCLIATYFILKEDILSFTEDEEEVPDEIAGESTGE